MKIRSEQLPGQLNKQTAPVYLLSGDEPLLREEALDQLRKHLQSQGFSEREVMHVDSSFNVDNLLHSANNLSLFAEQKIIELRFGAHKPNKQAADVLSQYLADPPQDNILIISANKIDGAGKKSAWYKTVDQKGVIVEIWPVELAQLPDWLRQRGASLGLQLKPDAVQLLCDRIEGNLLAADQELRKLSLLFGEQAIDAEIILEAVSDSSRYDIYGLTDTVLRGDAARALKILNVLQQDGTELPVLLWAISREIRALTAVKLAQQSGQSFDSVCQKEQIWGARKGLIRAAAPRTSYPALEETLIRAAQIDRIIKGLQRGDGWLEIRQICLTLAGSPLPLAPCH
ncbi:DNA polymerase III subunit delta [Neptuniibacter sp. CAU 1671]|uniref:DNA polymerase III subunit delta n=1 Tax=Neptuniibacter sp. CAU 1671 TaxID=3032593 RepID=UPI0023DA4113|nr:DNA polymerase III subunit delta [Neptuniibacter sp. CAU 1671]MDF2181727.1 DNA polymerase III subunit delta [Neptuniibacter sp. CAU 1671]